MSNTPSKPVTFICFHEGKYQQVDKATFITHTIAKHAQIREEKRLTEEHHATLRALGVDI
jgi:hypothetical protein